jgi:hypothetical protein
MWITVVVQGKNSTGGGTMAALELVAMDMKAQGMYVCRTLSFAGETQAERWGRLHSHRFRRQAAVALPGHGRAYLCSDCCAVLCCAAL